LGIYTNILRPLIFRIRPETTSHMAMLALWPKPLWILLRPLLLRKNRHLETSMGGIRLPNPVGLAAGYDKDCRVTGSLANLGFGYVVGGTVLATPWKGNTKPRIVRIPDRSSLINSLGFPSKGLEFAAGKLRKTSTGDARLLVSIAGYSKEEVVRCFSTLQPLVAGVELNISCPNAEGARIFQDAERLDELLTEMGRLKEKPLFVKLPPHFSDAERRLNMDLVDVCIRHSIEGVTLVNTWPVEDDRFATGRGGLSGKPLFGHMLRIVREVRQHAGDRLTINACGGIFSGEDALRALRAGADTLQVFTGFTYQGPILMRRINSYLLNFMEQEGLPSIDAIRREFPEYLSEDETGDRPLQRSRSGSRVRIG
jgi:dihydroorotate dehydrogenase